MHKNNPARTKYTYKNPNEEWKQVLKIKNGLCHSRNEFVSIPMPQAWWSINWVCFRRSFTTFFGRLIQWKEYADWCWRNIMPIIWFLRINVKIDEVGKIITYVRRGLGINYKTFKPNMVERKHLHRTWNLAFW